jgi:hypothetical protein
MIVQELTDERREAYAVSCFAEAKENYNQDSSK